MHSRLGSTLEEEGSLTTKEEGEGSGVICHAKTGLQATFHAGSTTWHTTSAREW